MNRRFNMEAMGGGHPLRTEQEQAALAFVRRAEQKKAAARARAVRAGRREAAQWGDIGQNAAVAPFLGPYGPIVIPNPKYFNDRKWDDGRSTELAQKVGAHRPWGLSAGPIAHWAQYEAASDRYNQRARALQPGPEATGAKSSRRRQQLPAVVRERLAAQQLQDRAAPPTEVSAEAAAEAARAAADASAAAVEAAHAARAATEAAGVAAARATAAADAAAEAEARADAEAEAAALAAQAAASAGAEERPRVPTLDLARLTLGASAMRAKSRQLASGDKSSMR